MSTPFARALPPRADFAQQKALARDLLEANRTPESAGSREAQARIRAVLPDKPRIVLADCQFVIAREYGFHDWAALKQHIEALRLAARGPHEQLHDAMARRDAVAVRRLLQTHAEFRPFINAPLFPFNAPALVHCASDDAMVAVLLEFGADPDRRSEWWAGGFHALHIARGAAAERLIAAGATVDCCGAAQLDRSDLVSSILRKDATRVHERGGDGQTPLHFARSREVIDMLLKAGADIDARDRDHRATPAQWMLARRRNADRFVLAEYLAQRGAHTDIFLAAALGRTDDVRALLTQDSSLLDLRTGHNAYGAQPPSSDHIYTWSIGANRTPLDVAAQFEQYETLSAMLEFATPAQRLHSACRRADADAARAVMREHPALMSSLTPRDRRAITDAAWDGDAAAVALMLDLGFDPGTTGHDAGTALHCASWQGSAETVAAILATPAGRALIDAREPHHGSTPLGWCCHGSLHGPRAGDFAQVARVLIAHGAAVEPFDASEAVEQVLFEGGADP